MSRRLLTAGVTLVAVVVLSVFITGGLTALAQTDNSTAAPPPPAVPDPGRGVASPPSGSPTTAGLDAAGVSYTTNAAAPAQQVAPAQPRTIADLLQRLKELAKARQDLDHEEQAVRAQIQKELVKQQEALQGLGIHPGQPPVVARPQTTDRKLLEKILDRLDKLERRLDRTEQRTTAEPPPGDAGKDTGTADAVPPAAAPDLAGGSVRSKPGPRPTAEGKK